MLSIIIIITILSFIYNLVTNKKRILHKITEVHPLKLTSEDGYYKNKKKENISLCWNEC